MFKTKLRHLNTIKLFWLWLLCCPASHALATSHSLTTPVQQSKMLAEHLISAMNSQNYNNMSAFVRNKISSQTLARISEAQYTGYLSAESHFHGKLTFHSIKMLNQTEQTNRASVLVYSKNTELWYNIELSNLVDKPHKMTRMRLRATQNPNTSSTPLSVQESLSKLEKYVDKLEQSDTFSGTLLIAKDNNIIFERAAGLASKRFNASNNLHTRFNLGSMNKMFTSTTILKLVENGDIALTDTLTNIFKLHSSNKQFDNIQIQHLLSHTSGVGGLSCEQGDNSITASKTDCLEKIKNIQLNFDSGTRYRYSNDGMFILGLVIEHITKETYYQAVKKHILAPANMTNTESLDLQFPVPNAAIGYSYSGLENDWKNNLFIHDKKGGPAGGGYSTVNDLFKFSKAFTKNKLLSPAMTQQAITPKAEFGANNYGFGFIITERNGKKVFGHNGSFPGVSSQMDIHVDSGYTVIALSNHSFGADPVIAKVNELFNL